MGAADDTVMRKRGIEFVDGSAPGFAAIVGAAPNPEIAKMIAEDYQKKNLYVFMCANQTGTTFSEQLVEAGVEIGWNTRLVPFGPGYFRRGICARFRKPGRHGLRRGQARRFQNRSEV